MSHRRSTRRRAVGGRGHIVALILRTLCFAAIAAAGPTLRATQDETPPRSVDDADDLRMSGKYEAAIAAYDALIAKASSPNRARRGLARCLIETGRYREALTGLRAAVDDDSAEREALIARLYAVTGRYDESIRHAESAVARDPKDPAARLALAEAFDRIGRRDDAIRRYEWFDRQLVEHDTLPNDAAWLTSVAVGFLRYSRFTQTDLSKRTEFVLNDLLKRAYQRVDRSYWPARVAAADLLREKFNNSEKDGSVADYQAALRLNPHLPQGHVGLGEVALVGWDFERAEHRVALALETNPRFAPALYLRGRKCLLERKYEDALAAAEEVLTTNPNDTVALSIAAAAKACRFDAAGVDAVRRRVESVNPHCAVFHRTLGDALGGIRQYAASQREYLRAIEFDPTDANARTELGMMYMQWGDEPAARQALEAAWALDSFNERTKFTLELLDQIEHMDRIETDRVIVRYDARRDPGIGRLVAESMNEVYDLVTGDFGVEPADKTIVEVFPTLRAFGVRITGKPWIYTVGASTGRVIALASPRDPAQTTRYDVASVLKHEFTHTVTLAATHNRIPHWFTEGLAVFEEDAPRSFAWRELLAAAVREDRLFSLASIDWGFIRPRRPDDRQLAYAQSEWMCEYIVERFGYDAIDTMLKGFQNGLTPDDVFEQKLGLKPAAFDAAFQTWATGEVKRWGFDASSPGDLDELRKRAASGQATAESLGRLARAEWLHGHAEGAIQVGRRALSLDAKNMDALVALCRGLGALAEQAEDPSGASRYDAEAEPLLLRLADLEPKGWTAPKLLAKIALRTGDDKDAVRWLKRLQSVCPIDPMSWGALGGIYLRRGQDDLALPQLKELARLEPTKTGVAFNVAMVLRRRGEVREAAYWLRRARSVDPFDPRVHVGLAELAEGAGRPEQALDEYVLLTKLEPRQAKYYEQAASLADGLGKPALAKTLARGAVALNPDSPARALLP